MFGKVFLLSALAAIAQAQDGIPMCECDAGGGFFLSDPRSERLAALHSKFRPGSLMVVVATAQGSATRGAQIPLAGTRCKQRRWDICTF